MASGLRAVVRRLPAAPGVYRFRDARGRVLYIGRATALRQRVGSYWTDLSDRRHLIRMVPQIVRIEGPVTAVRLHDGDGVLILVRPDGYVALVAATSDIPAVANTAARRASNSSIGGLRCGACR
jgi:hypothetical protein